MAQLMGIAFSVFNSHNLEEKKEQSQREKKRDEKHAKLIVPAISNNIGNVQPPQGNLGKP